MNKRGQTMLEYVIILTVIVGAIIVGVRPLFKNSVDRAVKDAEKAVSDVADDFLQYEGY